MYCNACELAHVNPLEILRAAFFVVDEKGPVAFDPDSFARHEPEFEPGVFWESHDFLRRTRTESRTREIRVVKTKLRVHENDFR